MVMSNDAVDNGPYIDNLCTILPGMWWPLAPGLASEHIKHLLQHLPRFSPTLNPKI